MLCTSYLGCSELNADIFDRFLQHNSICNCGHYYEDALYYLSICQTIILFDQCVLYVNGYDIQTVLFGNYSLSDDTLIQSVHEYFTLTKRVCK